MKSSIYISPEQIQVISHSGGKVNKFVTYPIPEGTMYSGTIIDGAFLAECLASMKKEHPELFKGKTTMVADGSSILTRRIVTPKLSHKQYQQLVRDDFADAIEDTDNLVCGYHKLEAADHTILGCTIDKTHVDSYISTFKTAGIRLDAIHVGAEEIISYVKSKPELQELTVAVNVVDGPVMLSMLFEHGRNVFITRTRLYGEEKEMLFQNMLEPLNGLIQFARAQQFADIKWSYYLGLNSADERLLDALNPHPEISVGVLDPYAGHEGLSPSAHFVCLNMMFGDNSIDLLAARRDLDKYKKSKRPKKLWIPIMAAYVVLLALPIVYLKLNVDKADDKVREVMAYIEAPAAIEKKLELDALSRETNLYGGAITQVEEKAAWEDAMPKARSDMLDLIIYSHGVDVTVMSFEFDEKTGVVQVKATCADAGVSTDYVDALYRSKVAKSVDYKGYGSDAEGLFSFTVDITLNVEGAQ